MRFLAYAVLVFACFTFGFAQNQNVNLIANVNDYPGFGYTDCWGYTAPNGNEYALLGVNAGVSIVDVTDPNNISEVDFLPFVNFGWYDMKTYQNYMYVSSEGSLSILIVDLSTLPDSASVAGNLSGLTSTPHNIFIDTEMGILYVIEDFNFNPAVRIFSLNDPLNPVELSTIGTANIGTDSHDVFAQDSVLYVAEGSNPSIGIFDVSDPANPSLLHRLIIPAAGYVHNVWVTEDNNYMVTTEETPGKTVKIWDIQDINNISLVSEYLGENLFAHNAYFEGDFVYVSHYGSGLKVLDFSDPTAVAEVGSYDTGVAWGVYPFTQNGMIFVSDIPTGLYILQFESEGPRIFASPFNIDFGILEVGTTSDPETVRVRSFGTENLTVSDILDPGAPFSLSGVPTLPVVISPGGSETFDVTFSPAGHGSFSDTVVITSNATSTPTFQIVLQGEGFIVTPAQADVIYATNSAFLFSVDQQTAATTQIGPTGFTSVVSTRVHPTTYEIIGLSPSGANHNLIRINSAFGDGHVLSTIPLPVLKGMGFRDDSTLYVGRITGQLYTVDLNTGASTLVANTGINIAGLALSPSGELWASVRPPASPVDAIYKISLPAGTATLVGSTGLGQTTDIIFDANGRLFGITGSGAQVNDFIRIDTTTGAGTVIGSMGIGGIQALAWRPDFATGVRESAEAPLPTVYALKQNYPNPFNPTTQIRYGLPQQSHVTATIYNVVGQEVTTLFDGVQAPGFHQITWNGTNATGIPVASGIYFYKLEANGLDGTQFINIKKMLLLK